MNFASLAAEIETRRTLTQQTVDALMAAHGTLAAYMQAADKIRRRLQVGPAADPKAFANALLDLHAMAKKPPPVTRADVQKIRAAIPNDPRLGPVRELLTRLDATITPIETAHREARRRPHAHDHGLQPRRGRERERKVALTRS